MDREKVINELEKLRKDLGYGLPDRSNAVVEYLNSLTDVIELLKEQEPVQVIQRENMHMLFWCCGSCGVVITEGDKFCRRCGKAVKWNENRSRTAKTDKLASIGRSGKLTMGK